MARRKALEDPPVEPPPRFDEAFARLREIVDRLEEGTLGLEDSLAEFEAGVGLLRTCTRILDEADRRIEILTGFDAEGRPRTEPFDAMATHEEAASDDVSSPSVERPVATTDDSNSDPGEGGSHPARKLFR
jgi:exodeoxyribonuclease VII small subunit